jgi:predicted PP-loop superfamily ATPase
MEVSGNALAYTLQALDKAIAYQVGWEALDDQVLTRLLGVIRVEQNGARRTNVCVAASTTADSTRTDKHTTTRTCVRACMIHH